MEKKPTPFAAFRAKSGMPLVEASKAFGVSTRTIIRWENGYTPIPVKRLAEVEKLTGIPRWELRPDVFKGMSA